MVASTEIVGAGVGAASQSNSLKEGHNSSHGSWAGAVQSSWGHHEGPVPRCHQC